MKTEILNDSVLNICILANREKHVKRYECSVSDEIGHPVRVTRH